MNEKTVADKMFLTTVKSIVVLNGEAHPGMVAQLPQQLIEQGNASGERAADLVLLIAMNQKQLDQYLPEAMARLGEKGSLWIAYMKQSAPKATDINRDTISATAQQHGATPVAIISVDMDWSALRLKRL